MKYIKQIIASLLLLSIPVISFGLVATWQATLPTAGIVSPTNINGVAQSIGVSGTATSTFAGPVSIKGYPVASTTCVSYVGEDCPYQVSPTSTSSDIVINAAEAAINSIGGGVVIMKHGTYIIHDVVLAYASTTLESEGQAKDVIIKADVGYKPSTTCPTGVGNWCMLIAATNPLFNSAVKGITWDGNVQNSLSTFSNTNAPNRLVDVRHATGFTFSDNIVKNGINWSVFVSNSHITHIEDNQVYGGYSSTYNQNDGIHIRSSDNFFIRGNYVDTTAGGGSGGDDAVVTGSSIAESDQDDWGGVITDNILKSRSRGILLFDEGNFNTRNIVVENNKITQSWATGILLQKIGNSNFGQLQSITINGNDVSNFGVGGTLPGDGIGIESSISPAVTVYKNVTINGNTIASSTIQDNASGIGAQGKGSGLVVTSNNMWNLVGTRGIQIGTASAPNTDAVISGNRIDLSIGTTTNTMGIFAYGLSRSIISNNEIYGNLVGTSNGIYIDAANTAGNDNQGIPRAEPSTFNTVVGNSIYNFDDGVVEANAGQNPDNNTYSDNHNNGVTVPYSLLGTNSQLTTFNGVNYGVATTSPGSLFSIGGVANFTTATSTFYGNGLNLTSGCFAIAGTCITGGGGGSGTVSSGLAGQLGYYNASGNTIVGTSTNPLYVTALYATTTTATSTFIGAVSVGTVQTTSRDNLVSIIGQRTYTTSGTSQADAGMVNINNGTNGREALEVFQPSTDTVSAPSLVRYENQNTSATNIMQINKTAATGAAANLLFDAIGQNCPAFESKELTWGTNSYWQWCAHQGQQLQDARNNADNAYVPVVSITSPFASSTLGSQRYTLFPGDYAVANGNWTNGSGTFNVFGTSTNSTMMNLTSVRGATEGDLFKVLQNGNVGIGTTSPADKLMVSINSIGSGITVDGTSAGQFAPQSALSVDDNQRFAFGVALGAGFFSNISASGDSVVRALGGTGRLIISNQQSGSILFGSGSSNGNDTTKMTMTSLGNFGIGTSTPYATLSVQSGASTGDAFVIATSTGNAVFGVDNDGHRFTSGPAPVISTCGTGTGTVVGDDQSGTITTATAATACTMTFSKAYRLTPTCTVTDNSLVGFADVSSVSVSAVTFGISSALTGGNLYYNCQYHK